MFDCVQNLADWIVYSLFSIAKGSKFADALNFFIYDTIKILILLFLITAVMGVVNSYFPVDKIRNFLSQNKLFGLEYLFASTFGAATPFCSCSSVPLFIGFVKGGIPLGVTFAFLITSPLVNEVAIAMFIGLFGVKATIIYVTSGILLGVIGGFILGKLNLEKQLSPWVQGILANSEKESDFEEEEITFAHRLPEIFQEAFGIIKSVFWYIIIGIGLGALMHGFIPTGFFEEYISKDNPLAVPVAVILGVPLYSNAAGVLPIIQVLVQKGIPIGTAIAFMMAVVGLSIPEATMLKKVMTWNLIAIFFSIITICIIISGYLFNIIL
ncbi:permease [Flavobacterium sp.]|jgi:uncharacterized membrane protein YraQ (UPF0718 family)|uniref:permease n=1 Tax=Flavobacterium sp. TaxID=239 RepID=UPI0037BFDFE6